MGKHKAVSGHEHHHGHLKKIENQKKVLVVEDDPLQQVLFTSMLKKISSQHSIPIKTEVASSLSEAVKALDNSYDFVLADIHLGSANSYKLQKLCMDYFKNTKIVFTSGNKLSQSIKPNSHNIARLPYISKTLHAGKYMNALEDQLFEGAKRVQKSSYSTPGMHLDWNQNALKLLIGILVIGSVLLYPSTRVFNIKQFIGQLTQGEGIWKTSR